MMSGQNYRARISAIAKRPDSYHVFGAGYKGHGYQLVSHSPHQIALFEEQLGVHLPDDYTQLLMQTGSGAGPYYGLWSPDKVLAEVASWNETCLKESGCVPNPSLPFPFQQSDADDIDSRNSPDPWENVGKAPDYSNGWIPICCQGCTFFDVLVTAGEQRGKIWSVNADGGPMLGWWPASGSPGLLNLMKDGSLEGLGKRGFRGRRIPSPPSPPTFLQWYDAWLQRVETDLDDYADYKARADSL
jgi:hypothetical protein